MRELNLLPPARRTRLRVQHLFGIVRHLLVLTAMSLTFIGLAGGAITGWFFWMTLADEQPAALQEQLRYYAQVRSQVANHNSNMRFVAEASSQRVEVSRLFAELLVAIPGGVTLSDIRIEIDQRSISLTGRARTRNDLAVLERQLGQLTWIEAVQAPSTNLLQRTDAEFTVQITIRPPAAAS